MHNFHNAVTDEAREQSFFEAGNGGHNLPNVVPPGAPSGAPLGMVDACSGNWSAKRIEFFTFEASFAGNDDYEGSSARAE